MCRIMNHLIYRSLDCKTNKSTSLWTAGACCVALARSGDRGNVTPLASGHVDGTLYLNGRLLLRYALPPTALALIPPYVCYHPSSNFWHCRFVVILRSMSWRKLLTTFFTELEHHSETFPFTVDCWILRWARRGLRGSEGRTASQPWTTAALRPAGPRHRCCQSFGAGKS